MHEMFRRLKDRIRSADFERRREAQVLNSRHPVHACRVVWDMRQASDIPIESND